MVKTADFSAVFTFHINKRWNTADTSCDGKLTLISYIKTMRDFWLSMIQLRYQVGTSLCQLVQTKVPLIGQVYKIQLK